VEQIDRMSPLLSSSDAVSPRTCGLTLESKRLNEAAE